MSKEKTSLAVIKTARLNPINHEEAVTLEYISELEKQGYNFKQIIVDAILARAGATPEMFTREKQSEHLAHVVEESFSKFAAELMQRISAGTIKVSASIDEDQNRSDGLSAFARNFGRGLLQRNQMTQGDDE